MSEEKMIKQSIAVFDPSEPWEKAIQAAAKSTTGNWLPSFPCQLLAKAVVSLQCDVNWLNEEDLMPIRAFHLFSPHLISDKQNLVFVTHLLFLRDILENNEINIQLHGPISFMTRPLAHFLFRHCPVHICLNSDLLRAANRKAEFVHVGGFLIAPKDSISLQGKGIIEDVHYHGPKNRVDQFLNIREDVISLRKSAAHVEFDDVGEETLYSSEHYRGIFPDDRVWDKEKRLEAVIREIEPSPSGDIHVEYKESGDIRKLSKGNFDVSFIILPKREGSNVLQS